MIALGYMVSPDLVNRLGWTAVHLLWIGLLAALVLAALSPLLSRRAAAVSYLVSCATLAAIVVAGGVAFAWSAHAPRWNSPLVRSVTPAMTPAPSKVTNAAPDAVPPHNPQAPLAKLRNLGVAAGHRLDPAMPFIGALWLLGVAIVSAVNLSRWRAARRLLRAADPCLDDAIVASVRRLAGMMSIRHAVGVLVCRGAVVPATIGFLRPVLLLPVSFGTGLAPRQIEAIIAHELAHIRRLDYLVNLLQIAVETLLFFHPAVWYISRRIRQERERCCDAAALAVCGNPLVYAEALLAAAQMGGRAPSVALGVNGPQLLPRIRDILQVSKPKPLRSALVPALVTLILAVGLLTVSLGPTVATSVQAMRVASHSTPPPATTRASVDAGPIRPQPRTTVLMMGQNPDFDAVMALVQRLDTRHPEWRAGVRSQGAVTVWRWTPEQANGYVVQTYFPNSRLAARGKPTGIFIWLLDADYAGTPLVDNRIWENGAPREIGRWRGRRVLLHGDGSFNGWTNYEGDILAALRDTEGDVAPVLPWYGSRPQ